MKKIFLVLVLCSFAGAMFAQGINWGITAGLNASSINMQDKGGFTMGYKAGFQAGVVMDWGITKDFSIIPELDFAQKGTKLTSDVSTNITLNYLMLPINAAYKFDLDADQKLMIFAGPYLGYGLSTSGDTYALSGDSYSSYTTGTGPEANFGSDVTNLKPFDFGVNVGVGYQYTHVFFKVQYNIGLANMSRIVDESWKNSNLGVTVGYMF